MSLTTIFQVYIRTQNVVYIMYIFEQLKNHLYLNKNLDIVDKFVRWLIFWLFL